MPQDLKDWLWRLDEIENSLNRVCPGRALKVGFTTFTLSTPISTKDMAAFSFVFGRALVCSTLSAPCCRTKEGDWRLGLGWTNQLTKGPKPYYIKINLDEEMEINLHRECPRGAMHFDKLGHVVSKQTLGLSEWHYLAHNCKDEEAVLWSEAFENIGKIEEACLQSCRDAPKAVTDALGDLTWIESWPIALLILSVMGIHPVLSGSAMHLPNASNYDEMFVEPGLDFRSATEAALQTFRRIAQPSPDAALSPPAGADTILHGDEKAILEALDKATVSLTMLPLTKILRKTEKTLRPRLRRLETLGYIERLFGDNSGFSITVNGRAWLTAHPA